jgi:hypothetical protein
VTLDPLKTGGEPRWSESVSSSGSTSGTHRVNLVTKLSILMVCNLGEVESVYRFSIQPRLNILMKTWPFLICQCVKHFHLIKELEILVLTECYVMFYLILPSWFSSSSVFPVQHIYLVDACLKAIEWFVKDAVTTKETVIVISSVVDIVCIRYIITHTLTEILGVCNLKMIGYGHLHKPLFFN